MAKEAPIVRHLIARMEIVFTSTNVTLKDLIHAIAPLPEEKYPCVRQKMARVLDPVEFDLSEGEPESSSLGETAAPVKVLPAVEFDFAEQHCVPILQVTLFLAPDGDPAGSSLDVMRFFDALSRCECGLGGVGLSWDPRSQAGSGVVRLSVTPNRQTGAKERLAKLVELITATTNGAAVAREFGESKRSFVKCEASVVEEAYCRGRSRRTRCGGVLRRKRRRCDSRSGRRLKKSHTVRIRSCSACHPVLMPWLSTQGLGSPVRW
jgi:hypothetical protein